MKREKAVDKSRDRPDKTGLAVGEREPQSAQLASFMAHDTPPRILESELTPRVRAAIEALKGEIDRLRREVQGLRKKLIEAERAANQDTLVPVLNRRAFVREIARFIAFAERYGTPASLLYVDLDGFKAVNDALGHAAGDAVLHHFSLLLSANVRDTDVVGRLGGDEFGVILAHATREQACQKGAGFADALRASRPSWRGQTVAVKFSFGAHELRAGEDPDIAIACADSAMYAHKRAR